MDTPRRRAAPLVRRDEGHERGEDGRHGVGSLARGNPQGRSRAGPLVGQFVPPGVEVEYRHPLRPLHEVHARRTHVVKRHLNHLPYATEYVHTHTMRPVLLIAVAWLTRMPRSRAHIHFMPGVLLLGPAATRPLHVRP